MSQVRQRHLPDTKLALLAGREIGFLGAWRAQRHLRECAQCRLRSEEFGALRNDLLNSDPGAALEDLNLNWNALASDMRANIRLGLEAGACVGSAPRARRASPRMAIAFASLCVLAASGLILSHSGTVPGKAGGSRIADAGQAKDFSARAYQAKADRNAGPTLAATAAGLELRTGGNSLTLLNHRGVIADQTVGSQGEIRARYVDSETGSVTINNVYLEQ